VPTVLSRSDQVARAIQGGNQHLVVESLTAILSIIVIDLVLSGDNAVVIGMAARSLSVENRRKAIIFGGVGAIGLRILFTALATILLGIP
jgi:predicted tellurium resistance membrane protein TerC